MSPSPSPRPGRGPVRASLPLSEKRLAANRANAKKSTGPRTAGGKNRSRFNAVRHGLTASVGLLPGEDRQALHDLSASVHADLRPRGQAEAVLVDQYVSIAWKLRRLGAAERQIAAEDFGRDLAQYFDDRDDHVWALNRPDFKDEANALGPPEVPEGKAAAVLVFQDLSQGTGPLLRLMDLEMRLRGTLSAVVKQLKDLRALRRQQAKDERDEEDGLEPWEPGEWDADPTRFGTYVDDPAGGEDLDEEDDDEVEENEEEQDGEESSLPVPPEAARHDDSSPVAQNEPTAEPGASPAPAAAQPQAPAPDARPAPDAAMAHSETSPAGNEPTEATASGPLSPGPAEGGVGAALVTPSLPTGGRGARSIGRGT